MTQESFFGPQQAPVVKAAGDQAVWMRVLITVKAAPNPSSAYGETVCVAGIRLDLDHSGWVRLYPVNFRELESGQRFAKYNVVVLRARPARADGRVESWRPDIPSLRVEASLKPWAPRRPYVEPYVLDSMCGVLQAVRNAPPARSLAAIRPRLVKDLKVRPHPGWTDLEKRKIEEYVGQLDMAGTDRTALEPPRMRGWYHYRCHAQACRGHEQGILDWEWVALQRRLAHLSDDALTDELRRKFLDEMCGPSRDPVFYVGNQAKRQQTFSVLGVYYPAR
ncbi:hypothetical protein ACTG9Q_32480 [Actinokineospora sp. 24-640]